MCRVATAMVAVLWLAGPAVAGIYKWIDADGQVHYGERPPTGSQPLEVKPQRAPSEARVGEARERWQGLIEQQERASQLRKEDEARAAEEEAQREAKAKSQCGHARGELDLYRMQVPIVTFDEEGERVYVDDERRAREIAELEQFVRTYCR